MHIDVGIAAFDRLAISRGALLGGASLVLALTLGVPSYALAGCATASTGTHAPSTATGTHTGATTSHGSGSSGISCSVTKSATTTSLAGVHEPGEAPKHASLGGVHTWTHSTINNNSQVHKTTTGTTIKKS